MKRSLTLILCFAAAFSLFAGGQGETGKSAASQADAKPMVLKYGELNPDGHVMVTVAKEFARLVKDKSAGKILIDVYPAGQLGDERTEIQGLQMGAIDLFRANANSLGDFGVKKANIFSLPYIFRDRAHIWKVLASPLGMDILNDVQVSKSGMVGVAFMEEGARHFFFRNAPVTNLEGMKGKKIRVPQTQLLVDTVKAFGAAPTPISYSELYSALQTGIVDGAENPPTGYLANNFFEVAKYYVLDGHTYSPSIMVMSEITWNKLSDAQKKIINDAGRETEKINKSVAEKADTDAFAELKKKGAVILTVDDLDKWPGMVKPVYEKYGSEYLDIINKILAVK
jgi:tripartite ATP-independent transporter DctP family solute receptor